MAPVEAANSPTKPIPSLWDMHKAKPPGIDSIIDECQEAITHKPRAFDNMSEVYEYQAEVATAAEKDLEAAIEGAAEDEDEE
jgi:hypothetical protein